MGICFVKNMFREKKEKEKKHRPGSPVPCNAETMRAMKKGMKDESSDKKLQTPSPCRKPKQRCIDWSKDGGGLKMSIAQRSARARSENDWRVVGGDMGA